MKLRNFILAIGLAAISAPAMAQYEGTSTIDRINMMLPDNDEAIRVLQEGGVELVSEEDIAAL